jgi:predicted enzyme related to lactoylglutathione lyase
MPVVGGVGPLGWPVPAVLMMPSEVRFMIETLNHQPGAFCFIEAGAADIESANSFYERIFGWVVDDRSPSDDVRYSRFLMSGKPVAGIYEFGSEQEAAAIPAQWLSYVSVVDAAATLARAIELGARALGEVVEVPGVVTVAEFVDPAGAVCGLWQPGSHIGASFIGEPGTLAWVDLLTPDPIEAASFYCNVFDWTFETEKPSSGIYRSTRSGNAVVAGTTTIVPEMGDVAPSWRAHIGVDDLNGAKAKIRSLGGSVEDGATRAPGAVRRTAAKDPNGIDFMLIETAPNT